MRCAELEAALDGGEGFAGLVGAGLGDEGVEEVFPKFAVPAEVDDGGGFFAFCIDQECDAAHG